MRHTVVCSPLDQVDTWAHGKAKRPATLLSWSRPAHRMHAFPKGPSRSSAPVGGRIDRAGYESEQVGSGNVHLGCSQAQRQEVAKRAPGCMCYGPNRSRLILEWRRKHFQLNSLGHPLKEIQARVKYTCERSKVIPVVRPQDGALHFGISRGAERRWRSCRVMVATTLRPFWKRAHVTCVRIWPRNTACCTWPGSN